MANHACITHPHIVTATVARLLQLHRDGYCASDIAQILNSEQRKTLLDRVFSKSSVARILAAIQQGKVGRYSRAARTLGLSAGA
jgi:hypothetical protein